MSRPASHTNGCTLLLLLLLLHVKAASSTISSPSQLLSTSVSASASANHRSARSTESANQLAAGGEDGKDGCSSDFVVKFFRLLSGPVGKEGEALVAAVLKLLSEDDRVNWPGMADPEPAQIIKSRDLLPAAKLRQIFLDGARKIRDNEKRMAPKFNPTGWRRKRSAPGLPKPLELLLRGLLARYDASELMAGDEAPKMAELTDDVKLLPPEMAEWQEGKRNSSPRRASLRRLSQRMPKRKPLEFNPTGW